MIPQNVASALRNQKGKKGPFFIMQLMVATGTTGLAPIVVEFAG